MKLWERYILGRVFRAFFFFLLCFFVVYVIGDLSAHGIRFYGKTSLSEVALHYGRTFSASLELFVSLTFLMASLRVLFHLTGHGELVALQMAGLSKKRLLRPFFLFAGLLTTLCYINSQWFTASALENTQLFMGFYKKHKNIAKAVRVHSISLEDDSELVYHKFNAEQNELFDVFWVRTPNDIWHMKFLQIEPLAGRFVNHFTRNDAKQLEKSESFSERAFPEIPWNHEAILHKFVPFDHRPLFTLFLQAFIDSTERPSVFTHLYYKILLPLLPFFALFAVTPLALRFSRSRPLFLIVAGSLFGLIALKVVLDGMLLIGESQTLPALIAMGGPVAFFLMLSLPSFVRLQ